jgi:2-polyprenyl-6-methoxyphenol hydroxylase-like FAD-dependent oxidoreductase
MQTYRLARDIPIEEDFDVLVAGGGPAGSAAAICAARLGPRLKAADDVNCRARPASNTGVQRGDESQQGNRVTAINPMQMRLLRSRHTGRNKPRGCTELDSKENSMTIAAPSL